MLKRLRCKFMIITMSIVSVMLCIILGLVYYFTKSNLESASISMMQNLEANPFQLRIPNEASENIHLPFFALQISSHGDLIATGGGYYDLSDEAFLINLISRTLSSPEYIGIIDEYHLRFCKVFTPTRQTIVFSDISSELATLGNLLKSCIAVGFLSFWAFFALSFRLTKWAVKPIDIAWQQQRQFIADASHELKTPLTVIITNAELMQNPDFDEENRAKFNSGILVMAKQMRGLVEQMLELARTESIRARAALSQINFSELAADAILPFEPVFFEKGLILNTEYEENIMINGDMSQLRQMIDILLDNAQKYSRENGTTRVTLKRSGKHHFIFSVANEGKAIPPEDIKNLFKRFYRADKARSRTGSYGLGLSIAEAIVSRHNGKIWAESREGVNTFIVELRCCSRKPGATPQA